MTLSPQDANSIRRRPTNHHPALGLLWLVLALAPAAPAFAQWHACTGANGFNMQSLTTRGSFAFAGGATGVYRSTNGAVSFTPSNSGNDAVGPTRGFANDANYIYTCTSQGVFRSANDGATWTPKNQGLANVLGHALIQVQGKLFHVGPGGVSRSDNQADTWTAAGLTGTDVRSITAIGSTLFVGTNSAGIYKSTNWGVSWTAINNGLTGTTFRAIEAKGDTLFAGGQIGTGVFRSLDQGASWTLLGGGLPNSAFRGFANDGRVIFAGSAMAGVFYSADNGNTWAAINSGLTDLAVFDLEIHQGTLMVATNTQGVFRFAMSNLIDLNGDLCIDATDLASLLGSWGPCTDCAADYNNDGVVDASDLVLVLAYWGACG